MRWCTSTGSSGRTPVPVTLGRRCRSCGIMQPRWRPPSTGDAMTSTSCLSADQVLRIARLDAERAYRDLSPYRISLALEADGSHVDYLLKDPNLNGGGPHYVIDS